MAPAPVRDATVLHVDDEPDFAALVGEFLGREQPSLSVRAATSVTEAMSILDTADVECIISDYDMPGTDGLEFLEMVRAEDPDLPFVLYTGRGSEEIASKAVSAGVTEYLQKDQGNDQYTILANRVLNLVSSYRAQAAVTQTEARYHNLVDTAPMPIVLFDAAGSVIYSNDAAVAFLNADSHDDLQGREMVEFLHPEDRPAARQRFDALISEGEPQPETRYRILTVDGEVKSATVATAPGTYEGEAVAQAMVYE